MNIQEIREHMKVIGADKQPVGTVDHVEGGRIKLSRSDPQANGKHHYIPGDWVDRIDGQQVCLTKNATEARQQWLDS